jgi:hypothetical protein
MHLRRDELDDAFKAYSSALATYDDVRRSRCRLCRGEDDEAAEDAPSLTTIVPLSSSDRPVPVAFLHACDGVSIAGARYHDCLKNDHQSSSRKRKSDHPRHHRRRL